MMQMYHSAFENEINLVILFRKILNKGKKKTTFESGLLKFRTC